MKKIIITIIVIVLITLATIFVLSQKKQGNSLIENNQVLNNHSTDTQTENLQQVEEVDLIDGNDMNNPEIRQETYEKKTFDYESIEGTVKKVEEFSHDALYPVLTRYALTEEGNVWYASYNFDEDNPEYVAQFGELTIGDGSSKVVDIYRENEPSIEIGAEFIQPSDLSYNNYLVLVLENGEKYCIDTSTFNLLPYDEFKASL